MTRTYLVVQCLVGSAIVNGVINGGIGWAATRSLAAMPLWGVPGVAGDLAGTAFGVTFGTCIGMVLQVKRDLGGEQLCGELLPGAASGSLHVCFAVTELDAGSDTSRIRTFARRAGSDYVISGRKVWITKAAQSQKAVLLARTDQPEPGGRPPPRDRLPEE